MNSVHPVLIVVLTIASYILIPICVIVGLIKFIKWFKSDKRAARVAEREQQKLLALQEEV